MLGSFFVNAASLFMLSAIIEKKILDKKDSKEVTTVNMPPALIEGFETVVLFSLMFILHNYLVFIFYTFAILVGINIMQRLSWANKILNNHKI